MSEPNSSLARFEYHWAMNQAPWVEHALMLDASDLNYDPILMFQVIDGTDAVLNKLLKK